MDMDSTEHLAQAGGSWAERLGGVRALWGG